MLKPRILNLLVVLAAVLFPVAIFFLPDWGWAILMSAVIGVAAWEWAGLAQFGKKGRLAYGLGLFAGLTAFWWFDIFNRGVWFGLLYPGLLYPDPDFPFLAQCYAFIILVFWFVVVPLWLRYRWPLKGVMGLVVGLFALIPAWWVANWGLANIFIPCIDCNAANVANRVVGFFIMTIAGVAEIGAHSAGQKFGKHQLAPAISPGKTWEGVAGGVIAVFFYLCVIFVPMGYSGEHQVFTYLFLAVILTATCVLGGLFGSLLKRQANVKDSSNLLPGHGGIHGLIGSLLALLGVLPALMAAASLLSH